ncbi:MAG: hypothetical protein M3Y87_37125, partial [Myxococcota bacterium]|nr:hypothetical protein [Myxococcota bacterium]
LALGWLETSAWGPLGMSALFALGLVLASRRRISAWFASVRTRFAPVRTEASGPAAPVVERISEPPPQPEPPPSL